MKKEKFMIAFDTICEGHQCAKDDNGNPDPILFDSYDEAFKELFDDAISGLEGGEEVDDAVICEMTSILRSGDVGAMEEFMMRNPDMNYYNEFVIKHSEFILGRKAVFNGQGVVIKGDKI